MFCPMCVWLKYCCVDDVFGQIQKKMSKKKLFDPVDIWSWYSQSIRCVYRSNHKWMVFGQMENECAKKWCVCRNKFTMGSYSKKDLPSIRFTWNAFQTGPSMPFRISVQTHPEPLESRGEIKLPSRQPNVISDVKQSQHAMFANWMILVYLVILCRQREKRENCVWPNFMYLKWTH